MLNRPTEYLLQTCEAGGVPKISERRPLTRISVTKRASLGCVGGLGVFAMLPAATPPKGPSTPSTFRNYAGPQHFCHYRGYDSAWVPGTVLGCPDPGDRSFSSGPILAVPGFRRSFVLRDPGHIKSQLSLKR